MITDKQTLRAELRQRFPRDHGQLLPALHFLQHEFGYLPEWATEVVGWHLGIPASEVYGAATSYTELRIQKPGSHTLRVCTGLGCWLNSGREIMQAAEAELGIHSGMTTSDERFTLEETPCGFLCGMAPAVQMDSQWKGRATPESVRAMIQEVGRP